MIYIKVMDTARGKESCISMADVSANFSGTLTDFVLKTLVRMDTSFTVGEEKFRDISALERVE